MKHIIYNAQCKGFFFWINDFLGKSSFPPRTVQAKALARNFTSFIFQILDLRAFFFFF